MPTDIHSLPGGDLIEIGLRDLSSGGTTIAALLVSIGTPRLRALGFQVDHPIPGAGPLLYERLHAEDQDSAHARYNALIRRLVSFERAAGCAT